MNCCLCRRNLAQACQLIFVVVFLVIALTALTQAAEPILLQDDSTLTTPELIKKREEEILSLEREKQKELKRLDGIFNEIFEPASKGTTDGVRFLLKIGGINLNEYEKFVRTIEEADLGFRSGQVISQGMPKLQQAIRQAAKLAWSFGKPPFPEKIPRTPKEAQKLLEEIKKDINEVKSALQNLALTGNAIGRHHEVMEQVKTIEKLKQEKTVELRKLKVAWQENQRAIAKEVQDRSKLGIPTKPNSKSNSVALRDRADKKTVFDLSSLTPDEREARRINEEKIAREMQERARQAVSLSKSSRGLDPILWDDWRDKGDRAFRNQAEEILFYKTYPELLKYRNIARYRSPATEVERDIANRTLSFGIKSENLAKKSTTDSRKPSGQLTVLQSDSSRQQVSNNTSKDKPDGTRAFLSSNSDLQGKVLSGNLPPEAKSQPIEVTSGTVQDPSQIPFGWIVCQCPSVHVGLGKFYNGVQYHQNSYKCP